MSALNDLFDGMRGVIFPFGGTTAPRGFLMCDGSAVSRAVYAALFAVIGTAFGPGDGSTTFNVPDMRGRVAAGVDNMGGSAAGRLTSGGSGITGTTLGAAGGAEAVEISVAQMPYHGHNVTDPGHSHAFTAAQVGASGPYMYGTSAQLINSEAGETGGAGTGITIQSNGGSEPHNNAQPTLVMNYVIKT